jgi:outer membrane protein assembly factor BamB
MMASDGVIYGSCGYAFDAVTGQRKFTTHFGTYNPAVADGILYDIDGSIPGKNTLRAVDAATGKTRWAVPIGGIQPGTIAVAQGVLYIEAGAGGKLDGHEITIFDPGTGRKKWAAPVGSAYTVVGFPAIAGGMIYVNGDKLYAFDAETGQQKWDLPFSNFSSAPNISSPAVADGVVYIVNPFKNKLYALDAVSGQQKWVAPAGSGSLVIASGTVFTLDYDTDTDKDKLYATPIPAHSGGTGNQG